MTKWIALVAAVALSAMVGTTCVLVATRPEARSIGPVKLADVPETFSRADSAGLFVGIQTFAHDKRMTVPYAVDDAVDLAYRFVLDQRVGLVPPRRAVLALSGEPQKPESKERLRELREAGVRIVNANTGDILHYLEEQARLAGRNGLLVFSLATHGFQERGEGYILGSTSTFGSTGASLKISTLLDVTARASRSVIFIDACRDRIGETSRGASPDPRSAAPHIRRMSGVHGQVIFYAAAPGGYAYDDDVHRNGVFTKAVLDGLDCAASAPRGAVLVDTLYTYVEREVRRWILENKKISVDAATFISIGGRAGNMPLSECWRNPGPRIRLSVDGAKIATFDEATRPLWRKEFGSEIVHAEAEDLDADAFSEVVVGLRDGILVFDRDGRPLWSSVGGDSMSLRTFTMGDLFEKHTQQIVALWQDEHSSRLTVLDRKGKELSDFEDAGPLLYVAVGRPTNMHVPKIAVATPTSVFVLQPSKVSSGVPLWRQALLTPAATIEGLRILDVDNDSRRDIVVSTTRGTTWFTFDGDIIRPKGDLAWKNVPRKRRGR